MSPSFQGLDRAVAPPPDTAKRMLDAINGRWWNVYIGGPESGGHGWSPEVVRQYARHGIDRFMLTYVGRQSRGPLTRAQGQADARDALEIAKSYGYSRDFPLCLDVELSTFNSSPSKTVEYARAWCATVRESGTRPGVYANPAPLTAMAKGKVPADFVWIASWVSTTAGRRDPHEAKGMPADLWPRAGQRAWQYGGIIRDKACTVLGLNVDINVADLACLAPTPGGQSGSAQLRPKRPRAVRRGDRGAVVARLTSRLSVLRSLRTGKPYLDGPRKRFDAETEAAVKAFQAEHGLVASGAYGRKSARALIKAMRREKEQQLANQGSSSAGNGARPAIEATRLPELVHEFQRLDAAADRAWQRLEAYGRKRQRLLSHAHPPPDREVNLGDVTASLSRIEKQLGTLVDLEKREVALAEEPVLPTQAVAAHIGELVGATATGQAYPPTGNATPGPQGAEANGSNGAGLKPAQPRLPLADLSDDELSGRIDGLDRHLDQARKVRVARYARAEKALATVTHAHQIAPGPKPKPGGSVRPKLKPGPTHPAAGAGQAKPPVVTTDNVRALQCSLNRFTQRYLEGIAPLIVDGKKGPETNKRIRTAKYYLGYGGAELRSAKVKPAFVRRLRHPRSPRYTGPAMLARAASLRKKQRKIAKRTAESPTEGTPKHIIDTIVLPIAEACGIHRTPAENDAANARHGTTVTGGRSDHQGPPGVAWAADISNGASPTPEMDKLARTLARRFNINWPGFGLVNATGDGYRFQLIYRTTVGGNHFNHVHFGVRDV